MPYPEGYRNRHHAKSDTGGWGFEGFKGDSKTERAVGKNAASACFQCHTSRKDRDYVFSSLGP